jgi:hypothetical protein
MKALLSLVMMLTMVCAASATTTVTLVPLEQGQPGSSSNPLLPSDEIFVFVTSNGGLIGLDCILTVTNGPATIISAIGDPCLADTDPWPPDAVLPPIIDPNGKQAEIGAGTFGPPVAGVVGWFWIHCDGPNDVNLQLSAGTSLGGSMDANFQVPTIAGQMTIHQVSEPPKNCQMPDVCLAQVMGDCTCDGWINLADLYALKAAFGQSAPWTDPYCCCDHNHDGAVNLGDLLVLKGSFGTGGYVPSTGNQSCAGVL